MAEKINYGGQAVMEGVMMRGQKAMVTAIRRPDGSLVTRAKPLPSIYTGRLRRTPLLRGVIVLVEALVLGINALFYSASVSLEDGEDEEVAGWLLWVIMAVALVVAISLFFIAPLFLTRLFNFRSSLLFNLVDGLIRVIIFLAYLKAMTLLPDIKRVFAYHGAEHKTIHAYEAGVPLEVEAVKKYGTAHPRCGTSFLFVVLVISIVVFALFGMHSASLMVLSRLILIPVIAALGYEAIYFGSRHTSNGFVRALMAPGLWLQSLTTREPDERQLEVAIAALKEAVAIDHPKPAAAAATEPSTSPENPPSTP